MSTSLTPSRSAWRCRCHTLWRSVSKSPSTALSLSASRCRLTGSSLSTSRSPSRRSWRSGWRSRWRRSCMLIGLLRRSYTSTSASKSQSRTPSRGSSRRLWRCLWKRSSQSRSRCPWRFTPTWSTACFTTRRARSAAGRSARAPAHRCTRRRSSRAGAAKPSPRRPSRPRRPSTAAHPRPPSRARASRALPRRWRVSRAEGRSRRLCTSLATTRPTPAATGAPASMAREGRLAATLGSDSCSSRPRTESQSRRWSPATRRTRAGRSRLAMSSCPSTASRPSTSTLIA
mmetsp:Transcript_48091/g.113884  ORF Transcript_48091/g.113884 Transcript_48091/m.113884 type:complete len:287 (+) Transcript_48091:963-1823(+)